MPFLSILALAVGLAMDAAAVSAARGLATPVLRPRHLLLVGVFFGGFQGLMPLLGFLLGSALGPLVQAFDHWIAFVLLVGLGGKMLWEARGGGDDDDKKPDGSGGVEPDLFGLKTMLLLAVATSIDAFAVGVMLPMLEAPLWLSVVTIGVTTAVLSMLALLAGRRLGALLGHRLDAVGGVVLVGMGIKILVEHTLLS
jgi:putative Mn2+ efflux pump MntP